MYEEKNFIDVILGRRSIRSYKNIEIADAEIDFILKAAMAAPSAVAKDPWRFIVIKKKQTLLAIAEVLPNGKMVATAALCVVVCGDIDVAHDKQLSYLLQDCSAAIENMLLAAHSRALGACWLGVHPREDRIAGLRLILSIPEKILPIACISLGYPAEMKEPRSRFSASSVHYEKW